MEGEEDGKNSPLAEGAVQQAVDHTRAGEADESSAEGDAEVGVAENLEVAVADSVVEA